MSTDLDSYVKQISKVKLLTHEECITLFRRARAGDAQAREHLIRANLRIVLNIAKRFKRRTSSMDDVIQAGNYGLIRAVDGFDPDRGFRFSTYAYRCIKQFMKLRVSGDSRPVTVPDNQLVAISRAYSMIRDNAARCGQQLTDSQVIERMPARTANIARAISVANASVERNGENRHGKHNNVLTMIKAKEPETVQAELAESASILWRNVEELHPRLKTVIRMRFLDDEPATLSEIGRVLGVSRERIRQMENQAIKILRSMYENPDD